MPGNSRYKIYSTKIAVVLIAGLSVLIPWLLGGQLISVQLTALVVSGLALGLALVTKSRSIRIPMAGVFLLTIYVLIQYFNPSQVQEWRLGLRIWYLQPIPHISWLPSSIKTDFTEASPLRFLTVFLTASLLSLACYSMRERAVKRVLLPLMALNASLVALTGLIQKSLGSQSMLGLYRPVDEGLGLFFATFLYKNHAAAYLNLGLAVSLACFFQFSRQKITNKSNPRLLFIIAAGVLFAGVIFSGSRFGFLCSLAILISFLLLALKRKRKSGISKRWLLVGVSGMTILALVGGFKIMSSQGAQHLKTLNTEITQDFSYQQRILTYKSGWDMHLDKFFYGWGADNFRHGFRLFQNVEEEAAAGFNPNLKRGNRSFFWQHAHNDYLEWLIELGLIGSLIFFSIPAYFFWIIFTSGRWTDPVALMLLAGLGNTLIHALIDFPFRNPAVLLTWFVLLTITAGICRERRRPKRTETG